MEDAEINKDIPFPPQQQTDSTRTYSYTPKNIVGFPKTDAEISEWLKNADNIKKLEDEINSEATKQPQSGEQNQKKNIGVRYKITAKTKDGKSFLRTYNTKAPQIEIPIATTIVNCEIVLLEGHKLKDETTQGSEINKQFDLTINKPNA